MVYAQALLHLFNEETVKKYINAAKPFVKPGGMFIGAHAGSSPPGALARASGEDPSLAPWMYDMAGFKAVLEEAGFTDVKITPSTFSDFLRRRGFGEAVWKDNDLIDVFGDRQLIWMTWSAKRASHAS